VSDRRLAERVSVRLTATYRSPHGIVEGIITDLSQRGLFFCGPTPDEIGTNAVVEVYLSDRRLKLAGHLARRQHQGSAGVGFCFSELADHAKRHIANIVLSAHSAR
jgi:PilZ domain